MSSAIYNLNKDIVIEEIDGVVCIFNKNYNDTHILSTLISKILMQLGYNSISHSNLVDIIENTSPDIDLESHQIITMLEEKHLIISSPHFIN